jgi:hypothetical protein
MKIELYLEPEQTSEIVRRALMESYNIACDYRGDCDYELIKSLMTVIEYYSTKQEYEEFLTFISQESNESLLQ